MIRILICDDDLAFAQGLRTRVRDLLEQRDLQARILVHRYAEEIPPESMEQCDIAFLDVDFSGKQYTGIDIARMLRGKREHAVILFVTNFPEYAPEGYEVQAFRYLLKSAVPEKLEDYLTQALEQLETSSQTLAVEVDGQTLRVPLAEILYLEAQLHASVLYRLDTKKGTVSTLCVRAAIGTLEQTLESQGFLRIHKSYLVNMRHLRKYQCREAELTDGTRLRVSEKNYAQQKKQYLLWKGR